MALEDLTDITAGDGQIEYVGLDQQRQPKDPNYDLAQYNPFAAPRNSTWDAQCMDRMLTIKRPVVPSGTIWITESGFAETLALLPLNKQEQKAYWRKFRKIQMVASGELNAKIVDSRQERLLMELVTQKSRLDVAANGNTNERLAWITNYQSVEQTLKTPPPSQPKGFFGSVVGGLAGNR